MTHEQTETKDHPPDRERASVSLQKSPGKPACAAPIRHTRYLRAAFWAWRALPWLLTAAAVLVAIGLGRTTWRRFVEAPWTRDGTVRAYVVTMASEVAGRIVELSITDNQYVHKGELLMVIDPTDYQIAVSRGAAALQQAKLDAQNLLQEAQRRERLAKLDAVAQEQAQNYDTSARIAQVLIAQAEANLRQARVNLARTQIRSPVNGWVTNLLAQRDDYVTVGQNEISLVDADSFWVDAYFEETKLSAVCEHDPADIELMGYPISINGHVNSVARGIHVPNAQPNEQGLATVNPIYTWVRLAQRIPVRIDIDGVPAGVRLVAGLTATVRIVPPTDTKGSPVMSSRVCRIIEDGRVASSTRLGARTLPQASR